MSHMDESDPKSKPTGAGWEQSKPHADENTTDLYWAMLMDVESHTNPEKDILGKMLVEAAYRHWNRLRPNSTIKPRWER